MQPHISIDPALRAAWPQSGLGCLVYAVSVTKEPAPLWEYTTAIVQEIQAKLVDAPLTDMPGITDARAAFKAFGADPGRNRVSSEALYRRIRQGKDLYHINSLVDANNLASIETGYSLGSYDLAAIGESLSFRLGKPEETYAGIGKTQIPLENMPLLADESGPFGSPTSDSERAMITENTQRAITVLYSFSGPEKLEKALALAEERLTRYAGAKDVATCIV